jgi:hypothetical protein
MIRVAGGIEALTKPTPIARIKKSLFGSFSAEKELLA